MTTEAGRPKLSAKPHIVGNRYDSSVHKRWYCIGVLRSTIAALAAPLVRYVARIQTYWRKKSVGRQPLLSCRSSSFGGTESTPQTSETETHSATPMIRWRFISAADLRQA